MLCTLSHLDGQVIEQIKALEDELHQTLLAFSCHNVNPTPLETDKLAKIQELENKLGISLVAVQQDH
jgi:hypothetical protein